MCAWGGQLATITWHTVAETVPTWFLLNLKVVQVIVRRISARFQYNCAKNGKGLKIGTKEADTTYGYMYLKTYSKFTFYIKSQGRVSDENFLYCCMHLASKISSCGVWTILDKNTHFYLLLKFSIFFGMYLKTYMDISVIFSKWLHLELWGNFCFLLHKIVSLVLHLLQTFVHT